MAEIEVKDSLRATLDGILIIRGWWGGRIGHSSIGDLLLDTPLLIALRSPDLLFGEYRSKQR